MSLRSSKLSKPQMQRFPVSHLKSFGLFVQLNVVMYIAFMSIRGRPSDERTGPLDP